MNKSLRAQVALAELEAMGLTVDDLVVAAGRDRSAPPPKRTVAEYLPVVAAGYKPRTRRTYNSYWILMVELIGDRPLDQVTVEDLLAVADVRCGADDDPLDRHRRTGHRAPVTSTRSRVPMRTATRRRVPSHRSRLAEQRGVLAEAHGALIDACPRHER